VELTRVNNPLPLAAEHDCQSRTAAQGEAGGEFLDLLLRSGGAPNSQAREGDAEQCPLSASGAAQPAVLELPLGHGQASAETGPALRSIARILWQMAHRGESRTELQLLPRELGRLTLCIEIRGDEVHVQAHAADERVLQLLVEGKDELAAGLARWGLRLGSFWAGSSEGAIVEPGAHPRPAQDDETTNAKHPEQADHSGCSFFEVVI
jgi:hypothetical protein